MDFSSMLIRPAWGSQQEPEENQHSAVSGCWSHNPLVVEECKYPMILIQHIPSVFLSPCLFHISGGPDSAPASTSVHPVWEAPYLSVSAAVLFGEPRSALSIHLIRHWHPADCFLSAPVSDLWVPPPHRLFIPVNLVLAVVVTTHAHMCVWDGSVRAYILVNLLTAWHENIFVVCCKTRAFGVRGQRRPLQPTPSKPNLLHSHPNKLECPPTLAPPPPWLFAVPLHLASQLGPVIYFIHLFFSGPHMWGSWVKGLWVRGGAFAGTHIDSC